MGEKMTVENIKDLLKTTEYDFLRKDENLGNKIILLTLGGSYAFPMKRQVIY